MRKTTAQAIEEYIKKSGLAVDLAPKTPINENDEKTIREWLLKLQYGKNAMQDGLARQIALSLAKDIPPAKRKPGYLGLMELAFQNLFSNSALSLPILITEVQFLKGDFIVVGSGTSIQALSLPTSNELMTVKSFEELPAVKKQLERFIEKLEEIQSKKTNDEYLRARTNTLSAKNLLEALNNYDNDIESLIKALNYRHSKTGFTSDPFSAINSLVVQLVWLKVDRTGADALKHFWKILYPEITGVKNVLNNNKWPYYGNALLDTELVQGLPGRLIDYASIYQMGKISGKEKAIAQVQTSEADRVQKFASDHAFFWATKIESGLSFQNYHDFFKSLHSLVKKYERGRNGSGEYYIGDEAAEILLPYQQELARFSTYVSLLEDAAPLKIEAKKNHATENGVNSLIDVVNNLINLSTIKQDSSSCFKRNNKLLDIILADTGLVTELESTFIRYHEMEEDIKGRDHLNIAKSHLPDIKLDDHDEEQLVELARNPEKIDPDSKHALKVISEKFKKLLDEQEAAARRENVKGVRGITERVFNFAYKIGSDRFQQRAAFLKAFYENEEWVTAAYSGVTADDTDPLIFMLKAFNEFDLISMIKNKMENAIDAIIEKNQPLSLCHLGTLAKALGDTETFNAKICELIMKARPTGKAERAWESKFAALISATLKGKNALALEKLIESGHDYPPESFLEILDAESQNIYYSLCENKLLENLTYANYKDKLKQIPKSKYFHFLSAYLQKIEMSNLSEADLSMIIGLLSLTIDHATEKRIDTSEATTIISEHFLNAASFKILHKPGFEYSYRDLLIIFKKTLNKNMATLSDIPLLVILALSQSDGVWLSAIKRLQTLAIDDEIVLIIADAFKENTIYESKGTSLPFDTDEHISKICVFIASFQDDELQKRLLKAFFSTGLWLEKTRANDLSEPFSFIKKLMDEEKIEIQTPLTPERYHFIEKLIKQIATKQCVEDDDIIELQRATNSPISYLIMLEHAKEEGATQLIDLHASREAIKNIQLETDIMTLYEWLRINNRAISKAAFDRIVSLEEIKTFVCMIYMITAPHQLERLAKLLFLHEYIPGTNEYLEKHIIKRCANLLLENENFPYPKEKHAFPQFADSVTKSQVLIFCLQLTLPQVFDRDPFFDKALAIISTTPEAITEFQKIRSIRAPKFENISTAIAFLISPACNKHYGLIRHSIEVQQDSWIQQIDSVIGLQVQINYLNKDGLPQMFKETYSRKLISRAKDSRVFKELPFKALCCITDTIPEINVNFLEQLRDHQQCIELAEFIKRAQNLTPEQKETFFNKYRDGVIGKIKTVYDLYNIILISPKSFVNKMLMTRSSKLLELASDLCFPSELNQLLQIQRGSEPLIHFISLVLDLNISNTGFYFGRADDPKHIKFIQRHHPAIMKRVFDIYQLLCREQIAGDLKHGSSMRSLEAIIYSPDKYHANWSSLYHNQPLIREAWRLASILDERTRIRETYLAAFKQTVFGVSKATKRVIFFSRTLENNLKELQTNEAVHGTRLDKVIKATI